MVKEILRAQQLKIPLQMVLGSYYRGMDLKETDGAGRKLLFCQTQNIL